MSRLVFIPFELGSLTLQFHCNWRPSSDTADMVLPSILLWPFFCGGILAEQTQLGFSCCWDPPCAWDPPSALMKEPYSHKSNVFCCGTSYSLLSLCSPMLGCWHLFCGVQGACGAWSLSHWGPSTYYRAVDWLDWTQWCDSVPLQTHTTLEEMWKITSFTYQESIWLLSRLMVKLQFI